MGKQSKTKEAKKNEKFLDCGTVVLSNVSQKMSVQNTIYSWRVPKYRKLKQYVMYFRVFDSYEVKCVFKLFKTKSTLYVCLRCLKASNSMAQFYLLNEIDNTSLVSTAEEIHAGLFYGDFKLELFEDEESRYLQEGILTVSFRYVSNTLTDFKESQFDGVDVIADMDELCSDLRFMYLESLHPDFEIIVADYIFKAHKFILAARTDFFQQLFNSNPIVSSCRLKTLPGILHEVLLFVYCGELRDMDMTCMMEVMTLAMKLTINSLIDNCVAYFNRNVNESNLDHFQAFIDETQFRILDDIVRNVERRRLGQ